MKNTNFRKGGKISSHFNGLGTVNDEMVRERAREIAMINGRTDGDYIESDYQTAKRELLGMDENTPMEEQDNEKINAMTTWDEDPGSSGTKVDRVMPSDEQTVPERLVEEGSNEAYHDRMVLGSRPTDQA
jgi:hypothetical protein